MLPTRPLIRVEQCVSVSVTASSPRKFSRAYPNLKTVVWCQEEFAQPAARGASSNRSCGRDRAFGTRNCGMRRPASASTAPGYHAVPRGEASCADFECIRGLIRRERSL
ncbi:hypothetical protein ACFFYR_02000 [Paraburkholderia dipogonis]|uniref:hypothetical protein n=1 Tax=Paraburkholderia dipogonis TaxID=1211383 RepID=UPI0035EDFC09